MIIAQGSDPVKMDSQTVDKLVSQPREKCQLEALCGFSIDWKVY